MKEEWIIRRRPKGNKCPDEYSYVGRVTGGYGRAGGFSFILDPTKALVFDTEADAIRAVYTRNNEFGMEKEGRHPTVWKRVSPRHYEYERVV